MLNSGLFLFHSFNLPLAQGRREYYLGKNRISANKGDAMGFADSWFLSVAPIIIVAAMHICNLKMIARTNVH